MSASPMTWNEIDAVARTGDLMLFHSSEPLGEAIEAVTGGFYSHVGMIVRPDPSAPPLLWEESGVPIALDPVRGAKHTGAQLGELRAATAVIMTYHDQPFYRRLVLARGAAFEDAVQRVVTECEGCPFPSILHMAEHWFEGHFLDRAAPDTAMFCSQLVALTYQRAGLLSTKHVPNWYSPSSFSAKSDQVHLLGGASFEPEVPVDVTASAV